MKEIQRKRYMELLSKNETEDASKNLTGLKFYPKYYPLFDLLKAKDMVNDSEFREIYSK